MTLAKQFTTLNACSWPCTESSVPFSAQVFSFAPLLSVLLEGGHWLGVFRWNAADWAWLVYEGAGVML